ncbi:MAG: DNA polymerase IV [Selenomonadaceae bacterium]|nr:DNA polymerase IV [Selenomonadaceae bacterium]
MKQLVMHVDMDAFFASVEQLDHEEYRGKPLIIGGLAGRGVVSTCSYEARKFGVHSAMPMGRAQQLCPQGIFIEGNYPRYAEVSQQIFTIFTRYSPVIEPLSIDEAFLDLTGMEKIMETPLDYARKLKAEIREKTGIVASVGIAPNKFLAKLASDLDKPDGLVLISEDKIRQVLDPLPVGRIWGVGRRMNEQLENLGIQTIGQLYRADAHRLQQYVGENMARHLQQLASGIDYRIVAPRERAKSIGKEMTFTEDLQCREDAERVLLDLSCKVGWRLRKAGEKARTIQLKLRLSSGFKTYTRSRTLSEATCYDEEIYHTVLALFHELRIFRGIRLLGVSTAGFDDGRELNLFQDEGKKENLYAAIDKIRAKFGEGGITKAQLLCKDKRK